MFALTYGDIIGIVVLFAFGIVFLIGGRITEARPIFIIGIVLIVASIILTFSLNWYHTSFASGIRNYKDFQSEINQGLNREIIITAEDGREIFHYEGKIDIETDHTGSDRYILFESEEGQRYIIYYGVQDTVLIIEKEG